MLVTPVLSVLIVHRDTSALARDCVASLRAQSLAAPRGNGEIEILLVDNASRPDERAALEGVEARIVWNQENRGYGAALNQAAALARGELLLFSNADVWYFPGALGAMIEGLSSSRAAAVGPRLWWDRERRYLMPHADPIDLAHHFLRAAASASTRWARIRERLWLAAALRHWSARTNVAEPTLSGACILTRRDVLERYGGFDERFRLYFEDTDWCRRLRRAGEELAYVSAAEVAHFYDQSGAQYREAARGWFAESAGAYFTKHYGARLWRIAAAAAARLEQRRGRGRVRLPAEIDLGVLAAPPRLVLESPGGGERWLLLVSPEPACVPAGGRFLAEPVAELGAEFWSRLGAGDWFARLLELPSRRVLARWRWTRRS